MFASRLISILFVSLSARFPRAIAFYIVFELFLPFLRTVAPRVTRSRLVTGKYFAPEVNAP